MIVTFEMQCWGCGHRLQERMEVPLQRIDHQPFQLAAEHGTELCNGCIDKVQIMRKVLLSKPMNDADFAKVIDVLKKELGK